MTYSHMGSRGRRPALHIQREMHGALVRFAVSEHGTSQVIEHALQDRSIGSVQGVWRYPNFEMRPDVLQLHVVIIRPVLAFCRRYW